MREDPTKTFACVKCGEVKPSTREFYSRGSVGFLMNICKPCDKARLAEFRAKRPAYFRDHMRQIYHGIKPEKIRVYVTNSNAPTSAEQMRAWRKSNPERAREAQQAYRKANPLKVRTFVENRRALKLSAPGTHTAEQVRSQLYAQQGNCDYCYVHMGQAFTIDHVIPLSRGGSNGIENIVCACGSCNSSKGTKTGEEFRAYLSRKRAA